MAITPQFNIGLELTWLPKRRGKWQEFRRKSDAEKAAAQLQVKIDTSPVRSAFKVKADTFRSTLLFDQPHDSWCVEVNNTPIKASDLLSPSDSTALAFFALFEMAENLDLYPCVTRQTKDGVTEWPTGGGHIHVGTDFLAEDWSTLIYLHHIERGVCLDYVNYPFIRWLFSQWLDDVNSELPFGPPEIKSNYKWLRRWPKSRKLIQAAHNAALMCHSIKQRLASTGKPSYPTHEYRFFDMPRSVHELLLQVRFLTSWLTYHVNTHTLPSYTLTPSYFTKLATDLNFAQTEMEGFFGRLGLDFEDYTVFFDRNYVARIKYGKAV